MRKLAEFRVRGYDPCPWSVPNIGRNGGSYRTKKSKPYAGSLNLEDWQAEVAARAREAMGEQEPTTSSVAISMIFYARTPTDKRDGDLWTAAVEWSPKKKEWVKSRKGVRAQPDLINLIKGTEDALEGVVFHNDVSTRWICHAAMIYSYSPGVWVRVSEIEPGDAAEISLITGRGVS